VAERLEELARSTPSTRDRYVDVLRAVSILAVVFGHWFIGIVWWQGGLIRDTSAGASPQACGWGRGSFR
jgi:peptidoglycan/LPS O-acetylase OafA/YrhL